MLLYILAIMMKKIFNEFKRFAIQGNMIDMAVGIVVWAAFGGIISALVDNVIMPVFGIILQGVNFNDLSIGIGDAQIRYGSFIQALLEFLIIAFTLFLVIKAINTTTKKLKKPKKKWQEAPALTMEQELLIEIRDLLKKDKK